MDRQEQRRGPPHRYGGGYHGGGGGYRDREYRGRGGGGGGYRGGGRGDDRQNGGGNNWDRKRSGGGGHEYDQRPPKRHYSADEPPQPKEPPPEPMPLDIDVNAAIDGGQQGIFNWKSLPGSLTGLKNVTFHGRVQYLTPMEREMAMFIATNLNPFFKKCAHIAEEGTQASIDTNNSEVVTKMKSITAALLMGCEMLQLGMKNLNLLVLPDLLKVPEMQLVLNPESALEIGSVGMKALFDWLHGRKKVKKGLKKLCIKIAHQQFVNQFVQKLKWDFSDAHYAIRLICPQPLSEFFHAVGSSSIELKKLAADHAYLLRKYPSEGEPPEEPRDLVGRGVPAIMFTDQPKPAAK